jgi:hypothetical protein
MLIREVTAKLTKQYDPETDTWDVGATVGSQRNKRAGKIVVLPMNQIRSRFEGDDKADPEWKEARANIERIKKQIKQNISKIPPILVRRLPNQNTWQVVDGHHRFFAFQEMGIKTIPAVMLHAGQVQGQKYTEAIAPHGTPENEFQLMVGGAKPAAIVSPEHFKRMYKPVLDAYGWYAQELTIPGARYNSYIVATDAERLTTIARMLVNMNKNMDKGISPDEEYHTKLGRLLGYADSDIEDFLQSLRNRKKNES